MPLYKDGDRHSMTNYRPIAILSPINKIIEKLLFNRVTNFLHSSNFFYKKQYAYLSTRIAMLELIDEIETCIILRMLILVTVVL